MAGTDLATWLLAVDLWLNQQAPLTVDAGLSWEVTTTTDDEPAVAQVRVGKWSLVAEDPAALDLLAGMCKHAAAALRESNAGGVA